MFKSEFAMLVEQAKQWETQEQTERVQAVLDLIHDYDLVLRAIEALGYRTVASWDGYTLSSHAETGRHLLHDYATGLNREPKLEVSTVVKAGDVIVKSVFYEETRITFYEVVSVTKTIVTMREIERDFVVVDKEECEGSCTPKRGCFAPQGETIRKKMLRGDDGQISFRSSERFENFSLYRGGSVRCSWGWSCGPIIG